MDGTLDVVEMVATVQTGRLVTWSSGIGGVVSNVCQPDARLRARSMVALEVSDVGSEIVYAFENGDPTKPVILGKIIRPEETVESPAEEEVALPEGQSIDIEADGEKVEVTAEREIVLRCGKASITLTSAGKIILRGTYVSSRSSGVNKISGGSIQLN